MATNTPNLNLTNPELGKGEKYDLELWTENNNKIDAGVGNKVDKEVGKGLSTNDFTDADKEKIDVTIPAQLAEAEQRIDNGLTIKARNLIQNGDFREGTKDTTTSNADITVTGNELIMLANAINGTTIKSILLAKDNIYYHKVSLKTNSEKVSINIAGGGGRTFHSGSGVFETLSSRWNSTITGYSSATVMDRRELNWDNIHVKDWVLLNLTDIFGAGNEPTTETIDSILSEFPNMFFDGETPQLMNLKKIYELNIEEARINNNNLSDYSQLEINKLLEETDNITQKYVEKDFKNKLPNMKYGWKVEGYVSEIKHINSDFSTPKDISRTSAINLWVHISDVSNVNSVTLRIDDNGSTFSWFRAETRLTNGWNLLRFPVHYGVTNDWLICHRLSVDVNFSGRATVTVGGIFTERSEKAKILFVDDGAYKLFYDIAYPQLKARDIPVTWALNPSLIDVPAESTVERITREDLDNLALDSLSSFSFHSWASTQHDTLTSREVADDMIKCMRWIQKEGLQPQYWFRAAVVRNNAPNHAIMQDYLDGYATANSLNNVTTFPFESPYNIPRYSIIGNTNEDVDSLFEKLKKYRGLAVVYTHGISDRVGDTTLEKWGYFISQLDIALSEGWIEGVTYDMLKNKYNNNSKQTSENYLINSMFNQ